MSKTKNPFLAKVISSGRITIPEEVREIHKIEEGDIIELQIIKVVKKKKKGGGDPYPDPLSKPEEAEKNE